MAEYDLGTARGKVEIDADGATTGFGKATKSQNDFVKSNEKASAALTKSGAVMVGAGLGIAAGFGVAINAAATFEERISGIKAVSGATEAELDKIRKKALQLGADTKYSAAESALAMEELVKAGLSVEDVLNGAAEATVNLAAAGEIELPRAAEIAANAMNAFNLAAKDLPHVADLIAGAANASAISVEEFAMAMQQSSAVASLAGLSFDDLAVAIAAMGNAGIKGSDAGTSLKTFLQNLQPVTQKQIDLFKELGIVTADGTNQFYDQAGSLKPLAEVSQVLQDALAGMTDQQKQMALEVMFGSDAIRAAAVISNEGAAGFDALSASMGKVTAADVAATRMDNLKGSIEQLKGSVETMLIIIGQPLAESLRGWVDKLTELINAFSRLDESQRESIVTILQMASAFLTTLGTFLLIAGAAVKMKTAFAALGVIFGSVGLVVFLVIAVIVALAAALYVLYQRNETFREAVQNAWEWIRTNVIAIAKKVQQGIRAMIEAFNGQGMTSNGLIGWFERVGIAARAVVDWVTGTLIPALQSFAGFITGTVVPAIQWLASELMERLRSASEWVTNNVLPALVAFGEMVAAIAEVIVGAWDVIFPFVKAVFGAMVLFIGTALKAVFRIIKAIVSSILILWNEFGDNLFDIIKIAWNFIRETISAALKIITGIFQVITGILTLDWTKLWEGIKNIFQGAWNFIFAIARNAVAILGQIIEIGIGLIKAAWQIFWEFFHAIVENILAAVVASAKMALGFLLGIVQTYVNLITSVWDAAWAFVASILKGAWELMKSAVTGALNVMVSWFVAFPTRILAALANIGNTLLKKGKDLVGGFLNGAKEKALEMLQWLGGLGGKIKDMFGNAREWLKNAGKQVIKGLIDGFKNAWGDAKDWLSDRKDQIISLKGPPEDDAKLLINNGELIMAGLLRGLMNGWKPIEGEFDHMVRMIAAPPPSSPQLPASGGGGGDVHVHIHLPEGISADEAREKITDPQTLRQLANAVKAGSRQ